MSNKLELDLFDDSRIWLSGQDGMNPWEDGCRRLVNLLAQWVEEYSTEVCQAPVVETMPEQHRYIARLWRCLAHHWQQAIESDGTSTASIDYVDQRLRAGKGWRGKGKLNGNPLRDVTLALAMTLKDGRAPVVFEADYRGFCRAMASRTSAPRDDDQWWYEFLDFLAGYTGPPRQLDKYDGKSGLQNWLGRALVWFLWKWKKKRKFDPLPLDVDGETGDAPRPTIDDGEFLLLVQRTITKALAQLPAPDILLLKQIFCDRVKQKDIAKVLRIHPGNVVKRKHRALDKLRNGLADAMKRNLSADDCQLFRDVIKESPDDFGDLMYEALRTAQEGQP